MKKLRNDIIVIIFCCFCLYFNAAAKLNILVTIAPIHSLVKNVSGDKNKVELLLDKNTSPHHYHIKPSDLKKITDADVIFYVDDNFESFLINYLSKANLKAKIVKLSSIGDLSLIKTGKEKYDMHFWSSPDNARVIIDEVAGILSKKDQNNHDYYIENTKKIKIKLENLDKEIRGLVKQIQHKNYMLYHDGYRYFEKYYMLNNSGVINNDINIASGAKTIKNLKLKVKKNSVQCIFFEYHTSPDLVKKITSITNTKKGYLDIEQCYNQKDVAAEDKYFLMMKKNAENLLSCLSN